MQILQKDTFNYFGVNIFLYGLQNFVIGIKSELFEEHFLKCILLNFKIYENRAALFITFFN